MASLFFEDSSIDLIDLVGDERWARFKATFAKRHGLTRRQGIVDERFLASVPDSGLNVGQRIVVSRSNAERALGDLREFATALDSAWSAPAAHSLSSADPDDSSSARWAMTALPTQAKRGSAI